MAQWIGSFSIGISPFYPLNLLRLHEQKNVLLTPKSDITKPLTFKQLYLNHHPSCSAHTLSVSTKVIFAYVALTWWPNQPLSLKYSRTHLVVTIFLHLLHFLSISPLSRSPVAPTTYCWWAFRLFPNSHHCQWGSSLRTSHLIIERGRGNDLAAGIVRRRWSSKQMVVLIRDGGLASAWYGKGQHYSKGYHDEGRS